MKQLDLILQNPTGLHARPAAVFVEAARKFKSDVRVQHGNRKANGKSLLSILTLGVERGGQILITVEGPDEETALYTLKSLVTNDLGEDGSPGKLRDSKTNRQLLNDEHYMGRVLRGVPASPGIAVGPLYQLQKERIIVEENASNPSQEMERLKEAVTAVRKRLGTLQRQVRKHVSDSVAAIFKAQQTILDDPDIVDVARANINGGFSATKAWQTAIETTAKNLAKTEDELIAARAADVRDIGDQVLRFLIGKPSQRSDLPRDGVILVSDELSPSDAAKLDPERILGVCTSTGGLTSHAVIIVRELGIPAIVSVGPEVLELPSDKQAIIDGDTGIMTVGPDPATLAFARATQSERQLLSETEKKAATEPAVTEDGHGIKVLANIGRVREAKQARSFGAEGIGLLRTEFLFLNRSSPPTEDEQFEAYRDIVLVFQSLPVTIRTLDVGADKPLSYLPLPVEENPSLGQRGIRLTLEHPELLLTQSRSILRAAGTGSLKIMFPMVANFQEWKAARALVEGVREAAKAPTVELGIMIETPAAALLADVFARQVDFFSIGTNDLTQYTLAIDRAHQALSDQVDGLNPAVLRLIDRTVRAAHVEGKPVGICGELAADPWAIPILIGLGLDELSVNVRAIPAVKARVRSTKYSKAKELASQALDCATTAEVRRLTMPA